MDDRDDRLDWVKDLPADDDLGWVRDLAAGEPLKELDWDRDLEDPQGVVCDALMSAGKYMDRKASQWERVAGYLRDDSPMDPADARHLRHIREKGLSDPADAADRMARVYIEARQLIGRAGKTGGGRPLARVCVTTHGFRCRFQSV